jgi:twitching motility protein PilT
MIREIIGEGGFYGMQTFDASVVDLVRRGLVDVQEAMEASDNPHDLGLMLEQIGLRAPIPVGR